MQVQQAINEFGSVSALAAALGISVQAVYQWGSEVPPLRVYQIRDLVSAKDCAASVAVDADKSAKTEAPKEAA